MKKIFISAGTLAILSLSAQSNQDLMKKFEKQRIENNEKFDAYVSKTYGAKRSAEAQKEIEEKRSKLSGFTPDGNPLFLEAADLKQVKNSNADFLQNGTISGLTGSFNGENIKFTVFDGGRAFAGHTVFDNAPNRVTNKEAATGTTENYSSHATGVTGFIGAKSLATNLTFNGATVAVDLKGVASNSTFDNYSCQNTVLPGGSLESTVYQKIIIAAPKISNHSYSSIAGWTLYKLPSNGQQILLYNGNYAAGVNKDLNGTYYTSDQNYDQIVYANPSYVIVKSSGNSAATGPTGPVASGSQLPKYYVDSNNAFVQFASTDVLPLDNCKSGYDCIAHGSVAKNIIVVGATDIIATNDNRYTASTDVVRSYYSSAGPRDDGGIKPDISTTGTQVAYATTAENTTGSQQAGIDSGTSFSAPVVTGIIGLWMQVYKQLFPALELNAAAAKTLTVHSALEAGNVGPDAWYGWGYINAKKGAELLVGKSNNTIIFNDETLNNSIVNKKIVKASGTEPLKVTIAWTDPAAVPLASTWNEASNNRTSRLVNDLDLRIIDTTDNTIYYPWKLDANSPQNPATKADNTVDNVEQVVIDAPVAGRDYRIEISNK
ncbi:S8 family serine peptidase [Chryseobacterium tongliaoense]|uniref:S8 family serine peptidase n=1 Tax=Chryseobacterium tongliaoense TaxID=3240933 RepID=UPI00351837A8